MEVTVCSMMASIETMRASAMRQADELLSKKLKAIEDAEDCARVPRGADGFLSFLRGLTGSSVYNNGQTYVHVQNKRVIVIACGE